VEISELNRRITINTYLFGQNESGAPIKALNTTYQIWAKVEQKSGSRTLDNLGITYNEAYEVTVRYEGSRPLYKTNEIVYEDALLSIQSTNEISEGKKKWIKILAYSNGNNISASDSSFLNVAKMVHYEASGGETGFQNDELIGDWNVIIAFRDGVQYSYITSGTPTGKQVLYNKDDGTINFDTNLEAMKPGEISDIYLIA